MKVSLLNTDLYQLTMIQAYWEQSRHEDQACFQMFFRKGPFGCKGALVSGMEPLFTILEDFHFTKEDTAYLSEINGSSGSKLFKPKFLNFLNQARLTCDLQSVPEGTYMFPHEPIIRCEGALWQCQLLETLILNIINYSSLISTKAALICKSAGDSTVMDFGMRRAHGLNGALLASRAAFIGGCKGTSNVEAGKVYGLPVFGTHAHSWVMSFNDELTAFRAFADTYPDHCTLLIDTYDTLQGLENAMIVGKELQKKGKSLKGVRLDSGDLLALSKEVRARLDAQGFHNTRILASDELDEEKISQLLEQGAPIDMWGVGTRLITGKPDAALGGVYKLAAIQENGKWVPKHKVSNSVEKTSYYGRWNVCRHWGENGAWRGDQMLSLDGKEPVDVYFQKSGKEQLLLESAFIKGERVYKTPPLDATQKYAKEQMAKVAS